MQISRRALGGLLAAGVATPAMAATGAGSRQDEAVRLRAFVETTHPDGARASLDPEWRRLNEAFARDADRLDDAAYAVRAMQVLAWFRDGHTAVYAQALKGEMWTLRLPFGRTVFADGLYVTSAKDEALPLLGCRITRVGGTPIDIVAKRFAEVFPGAGDPMKHRWSILILSSPGVLHGLGLLQGGADEPIRLEGVGPGGSAVSATVRPRADAVAGRTPLMRTPGEIEAYATRRFGSAGDPIEGARNYVWADRPDGVIYVALDRMDDDDFKQPFAAFDKAFTTALETPGARRLIIDLRRNGGGNNFLTEGLRKRVQRSRFNRPGGLYVLIAPQTFSAAQNLANRLERETFAVFVGEPTGSSPNHCGDAKLFSPEGAGLPAMVSTVRWSDSAPFDKRTAIMPDVAMPVRFRDFIAGRDLALDAAIAHEDHRAFDDALLSAPWDRPSQAVAWAPFWADKSG